MAGFIEGQRSEGKASVRAPESGGATSGGSGISATDIGVARLRQGAVMGMPVPDLRTLDGLRTYLPVADGAATRAALAFVDLDAALAAHAATLEDLDSAEARFIAARGRVGADQPARATCAPRADDATHGAAEKHACHTDGTVPGRLRHRGLGSRRRSFAVREARERRLAERVRDAVDHLHHAPVEACGDIALKLAAVIAAGEAGPLDATAFPWSALRQLLTDVVGVSRTSPAI